MSCIFADFHVNDVSFLIFESKMAANILVSQQDRKDLDKYIRFFVIKAVQIIVQSRLGERKHTHCRTVSAGSDWVNQFSYKRSVIQSPRLSVIGFYISGVYFMFSYRISIKNLFWIYFTLYCVANIVAVIFTLFGWLMMSLFGHVSSNIWYNLKCWQQIICRLDTCSWICCVILLTLPQPNSTMCVDVVFAWLILFWNQYYYYMDFFFISILPFIYCSLT